MARIALFAKSLKSSDSHSPLDLCLLLLSLGHEIFLITSEQEDAPVHPRLSLIRPFQKWSFFESLKALPRLMQLAPEILLVIHTDDEKVGRFSELVPLFMKALPQSQLAIYFNDPPKPELSWSRLELYKQANFFIAPREEFLLSLGAEFRARKQIIPEESSAFDESLSEIEQDSLKSVQSMGTYALSLFPLKSQNQIDFFKNLAHQSSPLRFVIFEGFGNIPPYQRRKNWIQLEGLQHRFFMVNVGSHNFRKKLISSAEAVILSPFELQFDETELIHQHLDKLQVPAALSAEQIQLYSQYWRPGENCFRLDHDMPWVWEKPQFKSAPKESERPKDESANLWNRLLNEMGMS